MLTGERVQTLAHSSATVPSYCRPGNTTLASIPFAGLTLSTAGGTGSFQRQRALCTVVGAANLIRHEDYVCELHGLPGARASELWGLSSLGWNDEFKPFGTRVWEVLEMSASRGPRAAL